MIESKTAKKIGWGSDKYRWITGLTDEEKRLVLSGETVFFRIKKRHHTQSGFKVATARRDCSGRIRWDCKEPTRWELDMILLRLRYPVSPALGGDRLHQGTLLTDDEKQ